jgi:PPP family 3-phenylpropionic acid transporter
MNLHDRPESAIATMKDSPQHPTDGFAVRLGLFYAAIFLFGGIQLPFFPVWLESRGLDPRAIGLVVAVPMIVRIVVVPIVGYEADRRRALQAALLAVSMAGVLAMTVVGLVDGPVAILIAYAAAAVAFTPVLPLTDAYALSGLATRGGAYGPVRLWGSVAFIVGNIGAGILLAWIAPGHLIWLMVGALAFCAATAAALVPLDDGGSGATAAPSRRPRELVKIPGFAAVAAVAALVQPSHAAYYAFSTVAWRDAGLSGAAIGLLWGLGVVAEIVLFALSTRLPPYLGPIALLTIGSAGAAIRWIAMALDPPFAVLPVLQVLHAASFGATHLGAMAFLARAVPRDLAATAQGAISTASGIVMAVATGLSGLLYARAGGLAYLAMAAMALAGLGCCALAADRQRRG